MGQSDNPDHAEPDDAAARDLPPEVLADIQGLIDAMHDPGGIGEWASTSESVEHRHAQNVARSVDSSEKPSIDATPDAAVAPHATDALDVSADESAPATDQNPARSRSSKPKFQGASTFRAAAPEPKRRSGAVAARAKSKPRGSTFASAVAQIAPDVADPSIDARPQPSLEEDVVLDLGDATGTDDVVIDLVAEAPARAPDVDDRAREVETWNRWLIGGSPTHSAAKSNVAERGRSNALSDGVSTEVLIAESTSNSVLSSQPAVDAVEDPLVPGGFLEEAETMLAPRSGVASWLRYNWPFVLAVLFIVLGILLIISVATRG